MNTKELYEQRKEFMLAPTMFAKGGATLCIVLGLVASGYAFYSGLGLRFWGGYLLSAFFFFSISLGGLAFGAMQDVVGALWGRPIKRIHESFGAFLPLAGIMFLIMFVCIKLNVQHARDIYSWISNPDIIHHYYGKNVWLQENFMLVRDSIAILIILFVGRWQYKQTLTRDMVLMSGETLQAEKEGIAARDKLRYWSAPVLVVYSVCYSLLAFDLLMSLSPKWFSTLWAGWTFSIMMQTLCALLLLFMYMYKGKSIGPFIKRQQFHDVGKLMHGFTIFFAYLTYAHILTYWYGNVPEETEYYIHRLHQPWITIMLVILVLSFIFPLFALIPKVSKWTSGLTWPIAMGILVSQWLTYILVVIPDLVKAEEWRAPTIEAGMFLGVFGLFLMSVIWFAQKYPMMSIADPLFVKSINESHH